MRAIVVDKNQPYSQLKVTEAPEPNPGPEDVVVDIYSTGVNFFDALMAEGKYQEKPKHPFVLGSEFSGIISATSPIPTGCFFKAGQRVFGSARGAYAERIAISWHALLPVPDGVSLEEASGLTVTWPTSYEGIVGRGEVKKGEWVLVQAAAGGVGLPAVQIAKAFGAKVIATAGSAAKLDVCKRLGGADAVIDYNNKEWYKEVLKITGGKGVDIVFDPVGLIRDSLRCIAWKGRLVVVGFTSGSIEKIPMNLVLLKNVSVVGLHWGAYLKFEPARVHTVWEQVFELFRTGKAWPIVYEEIFDGLENATRGIEAVVKRKTWGKAIVRVRQGDPQPQKAYEKAKL